MVYKSEDHGKIMVDLLSNSNRNLYSVSFDHNNHSYCLSIDTLSAKPILSLARFWHTLERFCMKQVILGYSFEPKPNSRELAMLAALG